MLDGAYLKGACVRDTSGASGRLRRVTESKVEIDWDREGSSVPRTEIVLRQEDRFRYALQILTLDKGWASITDVLPAPSPSDQVVSEVRSILDEQSAHYPFKNKAVLGPGPEGEYHRKKNKWSCGGGGYVQYCIGIAEENYGKTLTLYIDPAKKAEYNRKYKRHLRNQRRAAKKAKETK